MSGHRPLRFLVGPQRRGLHDTTAQGLRYLPSSNALAGSGHVGLIRGAAMKLDRRTFLKGAAVTSAATAASAIIPSPALPAGAAFLRTDPSRPVWKKAPCRLCGVGCGLLVGIENGRAVAVRGDPDSPVSSGLACAKGYNAVQALSAADRLRQAQVRREGSLVAVPLGEALDLVAARLKDAAQHPDASALYGSAQWPVPDAYLATKLFKGMLGSDTVETSSRLYSASARAGQLGTFGQDGPIGSYEDLDHADVFVLWDINLAETDPVLFSRMLERKRANPAVRIIHVSTRTARTSYASDHTLLHQPHTALAVAHAVCHEIVARQWVDRPFVNAHVACRRGATAPAVLAPFADSSTGASWEEFQRFLDDYSPERVQAVSGLAAASIRWLASVYGDPLRKVVSVWGQAIHQDVSGTATNNALYSIHLLVGKIAEPGNGALALTGQPGGGSAVADAGTLAGTLPRGLLTDPADRARAAEIWGVQAEHIPTEAGPAALGLWQRLEAGQLKFLWIQATNPLVSLPNLDRYRAAARRRGCFLVVTEAYPTATTDAADVVLPAAMWLEREGIYANTERRLQHFERMVTPPGEAASDAWLMIEVARRLGFSAQFPYHPERYIADIWEEYARFWADSSTPLPALEALRAHSGVLWPCHGQREVRYRYNPQYDPAAETARGPYDFYGNPDHRARIWLRPDAPAAEAPDQAFPYWLTSGAVLEHWGTGTLTQRIPALHRALPAAYVELNREDANDLGIRNREQVRLTSRRGTLELQARIEYRSQLPRGHLFVPTFDEAHPIHRLTLDATCPVSGQPDAGKCAVRLERIGPREVE